MHWKMFYYWTPFWVILFVLVVQKKGESLVIRRQCHSLSLQMLEVLVSYMDCYHSTRFRQALEAPQQKKNFINLWFIKTSVKGLFKFNGNDFHVFIHLFLSCFLQNRIRIVKIASSATYVLQNLNFFHICSHLNRMQGSMELYFV
jgi:hypothetical protein